MGRKGKYETHVKPYLPEIPGWYETMTEGQIARKLGISVASFENYKVKYPELRGCLQRGKEILIEELRANLKRKALGYTYTETKTILRKDGDKDVRIVEKYERVAHPDTGAIHLLLKNLDSTWRNDDETTVQLKREQLEIARKKAEEW